MALSEDFRGAIDNNNIVRARIIMKNSLLADKSGAEFDEMLRYATGRVPDIIDVHDGETFRAESLWDEDYLNSQMVTLVQNFSVERIQLLKSIINKIYGANQYTTMQDIDATQTIENPYVKEEDSCSQRKIMGYSLVVVGAGMIVGGILVTEASAIVSLIGGVAVGAGAYILARK